MYSWYYIVYSLVLSIFVLDVAGFMNEPCFKFTFDLLDTFNISASVANVKIISEVQHLTFDP